MLRVFATGFLAWSRLLSRQYAAIQSRHQGFQALRFVLQENMSSASAWPRWEQPGLAQVRRSRRVLLGLPLDLRAQVAERFTGRVLLSYQGLVDGLVHGVFGQESYVRALLVRPDPVNAVLTL